MDKKYLDSPLLATGERVWRTYTGGKKLDEICGKDICEDTHFPELWLLSTVQATNSGRENIIEGLCKVKLGAEYISLKDVIARFPNEMLGREYNKKFGGDMGVLAKIIDSQERLTIQVHPTKAKARLYFDSEYGKTECWHILDTREDEVEVPSVYIGFKEGVTREVLEECFERQDLEKMLSLLHQVRVQKGDTFIIHGGLPHAIGAGCTLIEIQEPTDYTLRVEKTTPAGFQIDDRGCHQGIGVEKMMDCFAYEAGSLEGALSKCKLPGVVEKRDDNEFISLIDYKITPCFKMEKIVVNSRVHLQADNSFYGMYVISGSGELIDSNGISPISANDQYYVSTICDSFSIEVKNGPMEIIRFWGQRQ